MYEYTMLDAAMRDGTANRRCVFEVYARRLPGGRRYGVAAGLGRLLTQIQRFRLTDEQLAFLRDRKIVCPATAQWLENYSFTGTIRAYREGETYFPNSPILQVEASFAQATLLETLILSVLNYDSAVATAASRMTGAAAGRPCFDMGGRRINEYAAIAAARASIVGGFAGTANLAAAMDYNLPAIGTAAHAFTLLHDSEKDAFASQIAALGTGTTVLTDTYSIDEAIRTAVETAGPNLDAIRIDSGDLASVTRQARAELDSLGATNTKITVTNDLDEYAIAALTNAPVDSYGVGTRLVTGSGHPTCDMVYKLVEREDAAGHMQPVEKRAFGKRTYGWGKRAVRAYSHGKADAEIVIAGSAERRHDWTMPPSSGGIETRDLQILAIDHGDIDDSLTTPAALHAANDHRLASLRDLPFDAMSLKEGEPAIPTIIETV